MTMNKMVSTADNTWARRYGDIPAALQVYALGDLKMAHLTYYTLSAVILRDYLPDPDIVLNYFKSFSQWDPVNWFLKLLMCTLEGAEIHSTDMKRAVSRSEIVNCVRYRTGEDSLLADEPARCIRLWGRMRGSWPSLTRGGCRYLHQSRVGFVEMIKLCVQEKLKDYSRNRLPPVSSELRSYAVFGLSKESLDKVDFSKPAPGTRGLCRIKSLLPPELVMNPVDVKSYKIGKLCGKQDRSQSLIMMEWARLNTVLIADFLRRLGSDIQFQRFYRHLYDPFRHLFRRVFAQEALTVVLKDGLLMETLKKKYEEEEEIHQRVVKEEQIRARIHQRVVKEEQIRARRLLYLKNLIDSGDETERARWIEDIPQLPKYIVTRQKRHERGVKRKVPQMDPCPSCKRSKVQAHSQEFQRIGVAPDGEIDPGHVENPVNEDDPLRDDDNVEVVVEGVDADADDVDEVRVLGYRTGLSLTRI